MASSFDRLKELNLSRDEVNRIGEALKNQEFRKLLVEYVEEIQDPKNRQLYEDEVRQIEKERGQEVTFLHPTPGYVIKTSINGNQKGFINVCSNSNINKPSSVPTVKEGVRGLQWSLPHSLSPPHDDVDNKGVRCQVFDVLFHPDTLHLASKNASFRLILNNTAAEAIENNFNVTVDKKNLKFPKMTYKGMKRASIVRTPSKTITVDRSPEEQEIYDKIYSEIDAQRNVNNVKNSPRKIKTRRNSNEDTSSYTTPKYMIKHRSHVDIQEFIEHKDAKLNVTIPKELIVEIDLPLLKSSSDMILDVTEKTVQVISEKPAKYKLILTLPYQVNEVQGSAKFDKDLKKLVITLPVKHKHLLEITRDDSGVESSVDSDPHSPTSPESEEELFESEKELVSVIESVDTLKVVKSDSTDIRTKSSDDFLSTSFIHNLPEFNCNVFDNIVAFTFNVKNVREDSVVKKLLSEDSLIKVKFISVSSSFFNNYYSFYVKFPNHKFIEEEVTMETWDNNVILQVPLVSGNKEFRSYLYGNNEQNLTEKYIEEPAIINALLEKCDVFSETSSREEISKGNILEIDSSNKEEQKSEEAESSDSSKNVKMIKLQSKAIDILATSYESSGDELSASSFSPRKHKGILKRMSQNRSKFGRSVSESSLDDFISSSFENHHGSIECVPEEVKEDDESMSSSLKKTVRFNDVVMKQLFRSNSSILGQKKKNQRKARNKKRAHDRRYSESETSDFENKKEGDNKANDEMELKNDLLHEENKDKKDDGDIFLLEISN